MPRLTQGVTAQKLRDMDPRRFRAVVSSQLRDLGWRLEQRLPRPILGLVFPPVPLPPSVADRTVVLVGASVGRDWRLHRRYPRLRTLALYQFDKTPALAQALALRPDAVILKECAAYFPREPEHQTLVPRWIRTLRQAGIRPVLATVVPVTREHARHKPGRAEGLFAYNDWIRIYCEENKIPILDLEAAVRTSPEDRFLDGRLHAGDGLHLSARTYRERLDSLIPPLLLRTFGHG